MFRQGPKEALMRKRLLLAVILAAAALLVPACRKGDKGGRNAAVRTETVDGVTLVHDPALPLHPEKSVRFEEEISFGGEETGPGAVLKPGQYAVDRQNRVHIYESAEGVIKVFGEDGRFIRNVGRKGQGPGEFAQAYFLGFSPDGRLLVTDYQNRRTSIFGPEGDFLGSSQWTENVSMPYLVLDGAYVIMTTVFEAGSPKMFLKTYDFEGKELRNWGLFTSPAVKTVSRATSDGGGITIGMGVPFSPHSVLAGDDRLQRLYHCLSDAYRIEVYDAGGRLLRKIDRPYDRVPVTGADKEEFLSRASSANKEMRELYEGLPWPDVKTVTDRMLCDDRGFLWVETNEVRNEAGKKLTAYDVFDDEGRYDARVWLDAAPGKFAAGKMYRFKEDEETGVRVLTRYRVVWY
jgi:hypothetical protein